MSNRNGKYLILAAEDDEDDRFLIQDAFSQNKTNVKLNFVANGEELVDYLNFRNGYDQNNAPQPDLILLDLNLPKKAGLEALEEIKANAITRSIPVVVLTTSQSQDDVLRSYALGVSGFLVKPITFDELVDLISKLEGYWFGTVVLRGHHSHH